MLEKRLQPLGKNEIPFLKDVRYSKTKSPRQCGARFSANAFGPSMKSLLDLKVFIVGYSTLKESSKEAMLMLLYATSLLALTDKGPHSRI